MVKLMNDNKAAQADNETNVASSSEATLTNVDEAITLAATVPAEMPGSLLAARRKELRWSVEEIAGKLKLAPRRMTLRPCQAWPPCAVLSAHTPKYLVWIQSSS